MTYLDFKVGTDLYKQDIYFYALIVAAILKSDSSNLKKLKSAFPEIYEETFKRYESPGGCLNFFEWKAIHGKNIPEEELQKIKELYEKLSQNRNPNST